MKKTRVFLVLLMLMSLILLLPIRAEDNLSVSLENSENISVNKDENGYYDQPVEQNLSETYGEEEDATETSVLTEDISSGVNSSSVEDEKTESIFYPDERRRVVDSRLLPYQSVVDILAHTKNQYYAVGTGVLISHDKVLTAAHVLKNIHTGKWEDFVSVVPAKNGEVPLLNGPYGSYSGGVYHFLSAYNVSEVPSNDLAIITLDSSVVGVNPLQTTTVLNVGQNIKVIGYPSDKGEEMYESHGTVLEINSSIMKHRADTLSGNSGGPILDENNNIIAIHTSGVAENPSNTSYIQLYGKNTARIIDNTAMNLINMALTDSKSSTAVTKTIATYRLYHEGLKYHLYTTSGNEKNVLSRTAGWRFEGVSWRTNSIGNPVYRLYSPVLRKHLLTASENEKNVLIKSGWKDEGIIFHAGGSQNVYRLYHAGLKVHLYTTDINEYNTLPKNGWNKEGIAWSVE
ncbi:TPA: trypsin-like peptidase domain-containing protein [Streptococcus suis]